jgi:hypothetical protein
MACYRDSFVFLKKPGRECDHLHLGLRLRMHEAIPRTPVDVHGAVKHRDSVMSEWGHQCEHFCRHIIF